MNILELNNIYQKKNDNVILKNISFSIPEKSIYAIFGPSGSGKTTLLRLFNKLDIPSKGNILYRGVDLKEYDSKQLRKKVGMVFQMPLLFEGTVKDNISFAMYLSGKENEEDLYLHAIKEVGLSENILNMDITNISVGQAQRVMIARALISAPDVLLMDEPTSALDPTATIEIENLIKRINGEKGITILFVSHNPIQIERLATHGLFIVEGEIKIQGEITRILNNADTKEIAAFLKGEMK